MASPPSLPPCHPNEVMKQAAWVPNDIRQLTYFYPIINSSDAAANLLKKMNTRAGSFILRLSSKGEGSLTLSVNIGDHRVHHVNVLVKNGDYYIVPEVKFKNFEQLQKYYSDHRIGNKEKVDNVKLLYPVEKRSGSISSLTSQMSLPDLRPNLRDRKDSMGSDIRNSGSSNSDENNGHIHFRPPLPLPAIEKQPTDGVYTYAQPPVNRSEDLKSVLRNTEKCECGLLVADADLGNGWAVHKSRDTTNFGKLFYQNQYNKTSWYLPESILLKLSPEKLAFLYKLYAENKQTFPYDDVRMQRLKDAMMY